ncbi:uncharacterized protein VTP21DRAFT_3549 [Calcarisporiella thermophila]|uniref:uncharacterized protein n=1 Tax=Calcarisporiella thermophila TaxID=911321 RepID=UPI003742C7A4
MKQRYQLFVLALACWLICVASAQERAYSRAGPREPKTAHGSSDASEKMNAAGEMYASTAVGALAVVVAGMMAF